MKNKSIYLITSAILFALIILLWFASINQETLTAYGIFLILIPATTLLLAYFKPKKQSVIAMTIATIISILLHRESNILILLYKILGTLTGTSLTLLLMYYKNKSKIN